MHDNLCICTLYKHSTPSQKHTKQHQTSFYLSMMEILAWCTYNLYWFSLSISIRFACWLLNIRACIGGPFAKYLLLPNDKYNPSAFLCFSK